jgi:peptide methionine sulfoxide reductase msrA/msrB
MILKKSMQIAMAMLIPAAIIIAASLAISINAGEDNVSLRKLTPEEKEVIIDKGTERPFTGEYYRYNEAGTYVCKQCGAELYRSEDKFDSGCGWPSFDDEIPGTVKRTLDADGIRTEITCARCGGHLGHVFEGEGLTPKNTRYCVNSFSLDFISASNDKTSSEVTTEKAYFAGGCFWGVEYYLEQAEGVIDARSGYMGGSMEDPSYRDVCNKRTGHAETVEVVFDPSKTDFETIARLFFEIHDPTQVDRQGPDVGDQYRSEIFYTNDSQKMTAEKLIKILEGKGYKIATKLAKAGTFWPAEDYHQDYYSNHGKMPYCHGYTKRF